MRESLPQPVFGLPWLEHYKAPHSVEQKEERKAADTIWLDPEPGQLTPTEAPQPSPMLS